MNLEELTKDPQDDEQVSQVEKIMGQVENLPVQV